MAKAIALGGPGPWRQVRDLRPAIFRRQPRSVEAFSSYALWHPARRGMVAESVTQRQRTAFNRALQVTGLGLQTGLIGDKLAPEAPLRESGLPVVETLAVLSPDPRPTDARRLRDRAEVEALLADPPVRPLFGKPRADSYARGVLGAGERDGRPEPVRRGGGAGGGPRGQDRGGLADSSTRSTPIPASSTTGPPVGASAPPG